MHVCARRNEPPVSAVVKVLEEEEEENDVSLRAQPYRIKQAIVSFAKTLIAKAEGGEGEGEKGGEGGEGEEGEKMRIDEMAKYEKRQQEAAEGWTIDSIFLYVQQEGSSHWWRRCGGQWWLARHLRELTSWSSPTDALVVVRGNPMGHPAIESRLTQKHQEPQMTLRRPACLRAATVMLSVGICCVALAAANRLWIARRQLMGGKFATHFAQCHPYIRQLLGCSSRGGVAVVASVGTLSPRYINATLHLSSPNGLAQLQLTASRTNLSVAYDVIQSQLTCSEGSFKIDPNMLKN
eukprot:GHVS01107217.1.p1 GENE.GHVS01107217.1~~GHVS01107217.1.p1  ORF type:complete len:294 (-),score=75.77 GHVS01107217.1:203-1084(-)